MSLRRTIHDRQPLDSTSTSLDMVVNHCREDMSWVPVWMETLGIQNVYIYDKCGDPPTFNNTNIHITNLPNTGREGASWIHHMLHNKENFAHGMLFLQGGTETSLEAVIDTLQQIQQEEQATGDQVDFVDLCRHAKSGQAMSSRCPWPNTLCHYGVFNVEKLCDFHAKFATTERTYCSAAITTLRGEFYVTANAISRYLNDSQRQKNLEDLLVELDKENDPVLGHYLERNWGEMFAGKHLYLDRNGGILMPIMDWLTSCWDCRGFRGGTS